MNRFIVSIIMLISIFTATAAEFSCLCIEDTQTMHELETPHSDTGSSDHCGHACFQCHFVAVVPEVFHLFTQPSFPKLSHLGITDFPRENPRLLFRPPIS